MILLGIAFLAGLITAISPCVLPVLPILLGGGASGRRPFGIILGLVGSFSVFTVAGAALLDSLGLPQDTLRNLAIVLLLLLAATLLFPAVARVVERPLLRLTTRPAAHREQRDRARREPGPRLRPLRRARPGRGDRALGDRRRRARDVLRGRGLRERRRRSDAGDRRRGQEAHRGCRLLPPARGDDPPFRRRVDRGLRDRNRDRRRPRLHDRGPRLHRGAAEEGRAERHGEARARPAPAHRR